MFVSLEAIPFPHHSQPVIHIVLVLGTIQGNADFFRRWVTNPEISLVECWAQIIKYPNLLW